MPHHHQTNNAKGNLCKLIFVSRVRKNRIGAGYLIGVAVLWALVGAATAATADDDAPPPSTATSSGVDWGPHFFPLFYADRDPDRDLNEIDLIWPLGLWQRGLEGTGQLIALHPFFSLGGDPTGRFQFWDILYPLAGSRTGLGEPPTQDILRRRWVLPF
jgi:hypothetical protein